MKESLLHILNSLQFIETYLSKRRSIVRGKIILPSRPVSSYKICITVYKQIDIFCLPIVIFTAIYIYTSSLVSQKIIYFVRQSLNKTLWKVEDKDVKLYFVLQNAIKKIVQFNSEFSIRISTLKLTYIIHVGCWKINSLRPSFGWFEKPLRKLCYQQCKGPRLSVCKAHVTIGLT